ncbi:ATP-grasp domain-containing protein [Kribbella sp. NPDC059898]|uniref:ATP-grasp domain-containing protein n=1 Tax=Kribbella sp. NPDC059898 TaxID=3346995 RepID=UPI003660009A
MLLVPADPLNPRRVDPHFAGQAAAARDRGIPVARIDHDAIADPERAVAGVPPAEDAVYRGWMMTADEYDGFARALATRGVVLRTSPAAYRAAHELPGWYDAVRECTPESTWTDGDDVPQVLAAAERLGAGPAVLRDYVKSMKHYWDEAAYVPEVADREGVERVARRFRELREDSFSGGYVLRRFEDFAGAEARTWWVGGRCVVVTPHPDTPAELPEGLDPSALELLLGGVGTSFVAVDVVWRADGVLRVVEVGDGQVSDWPGTWDPAELVDCLFRDNGW